MLEQIPENSITPSAKIVNISNSINHPYITLKPCFVDCNGNCDIDKFFSRSNNIVIDMFVSSDDMNTIKFGNDCVDNLQKINVFGHSYSDDFINKISYYKNSVIAEMAIA
jgi:hypothetical protein